MALSAWINFISQHTEGDLVQGRVSKVVPFGVFVDIAEGVSGLLVTDNRLQAGATVPVRIKDIDDVKHRVSLAHA
jgi:small subunit ribosomal protein S1